MRILIFRKKTLIRVAVIAAVLIAAVFVTRAVIGGEAAIYNEQEGVVTRVATSEKQVALTFDTSFGDDQTEKILSVLKDAQIPATFAVMGVWAQENPELTKRIALAGHEVISHSMEHERYPELDRDAVAADLAAANAAILNIAGVSTSTVRAPYGAYDDETLAVIADANMKAVKWSVDSGDWRQEGAQSVLSRVMENVQAGDVILFQNNQEDTAEALPEILAALKERHFECVRLSELMTQS